MAQPGPMAQSVASAPPNAEATEPSGSGRFGTFGGVFTPSILTILGVVMYMRFGWVTGHSGLAQAMVIVAVAHLISLATGLSVASIATNRTVGAGGAYYMISRSLGAPAGAAIGIPLFLGQALSVTFYVVGFTESVVSLVGMVAPNWLPYFPDRVVSSVVCLLLTGLSLKSAELVIKAQYFVMATIGVSLVAFFLGTGPEPPAHIEWWNHEEDAASFAEVFAVFFPAVTGIMAGVGMSGDLKNPRRSIPRGTLLAILAGFVIYMLFPVWLAMNASNRQMMDDVNIVWTISAVPALIYVGVWGATLSSALGSLLTAPRTLQALAADGLAPRFLSKGYGASNEPRAGILFTFVLAQTGVLLGDLDAIAPILTMFFLATYGITNLACGLEKWAASPSFRPDFRVNAGISMAGAMSCFYVMNMINKQAMFGALMVCGVIYVVAQRRALGTTYGDARHGIWSALVRSALHQLRRVRFHPQNWRPNLLILGGTPDKRPHLLELGSAIVQDRGMVSYFHLLKGSVADLALPRSTLLKRVESEVAENFPNVFYRVDIVDDIYRGIVGVAQSYGLGNFEANTVMLGWLSKNDRADTYVAMLRDLVRLDRSLYLVRHRPERHFGDRRQIHVWWGGLQGNGGLMLLTAYLLTADFDWKRAEVTLNTVVDDQHAQAAVEAALHKTLESARLPASARVIMRQGRSIPDIMFAESNRADLVILGLPPLDTEISGELYVERINRLLDKLPTTLMVHSARNFDSDPVLFDTPT